MQRNLNRDNSPYAIAIINGSEKYNNVKGRVNLYNIKNGTLFKIEIEGLPSESKNNFFGFHIHEGAECKTQENILDFEVAGEHFNPENDKHPNHIGDLPMIYSNNGYSYMQFYTNRFTPNIVVGRTLIIHKEMDDLITDPAGNSGERIACGKIIRYI